MKQPRARFSAGAKPGAGEHPQHIDAAESNNSWAWIQTMAQAGFTVSVVELKYDAHALRQFGPPEVLAGQLISEEWGHFDSILQGDPFRLYFYLFSTTLPDGLRFIKARLDKFGLLAACKIGHADAQDKCWRTYYPEMEAGA